MPAVNEKDLEAKMAAFQQLLQERGRAPAAEVMDTEHKESVLDLLNQQAESAETPEEKAQKLMEVQQMREAIRSKFGTQAPAPEPTMTPAPVDARLQALKQLNDRANPTMDIEQLKAALNKKR